MKYDVIYKDPQGNLYCYVDKTHIMNLQTGECVAPSIYDKVIILSDQQEAILSHIVRHGSIDSYNAYLGLNIVALTTRISEMRAKGIPIKFKTIRYTANDGTHKHYNKYYLWEDDSQLQFEEVQLK